MAAGRCVNCESLLEAAFTHCPGCGQKATVRRFSLGQIVAEAFHELTHADKGLVLLVKGLATRPGTVAREYVLEGKRKRYFNPFTFLALALGASVTVNVLVHPYQERLSSLPARATAAQRALFVRQDAFFRFLEERANVVALLAIPIYAAVVWLLFWLFSGRRRVFYAEVLVAQVLFSGFTILVDALFMTPFVHHFPNPLTFALVRMALTAVYGAVAYRSFFELRGPLSFVKTGLASILAIFVWSVLSVGAGYLYIRHG